jgi:hypothetical protein
MLLLLLLQVEGYVLVWESGSRAAVDYVEAWTRICYSS